MSSSVEVRLSAAAAASVTAGHPWVFGSTARIDPGTVVTLVGPEGRVGWGVADRGPISIRVLGRGATGDLARTLADRIRRADQVRIRLLDPQTDAYRVVAGAGDGLPGLVVDRYDDLAVVRLYAEAWQPHLDAVVHSVASLGWVSTVFRRFGVARVDGRTGGAVLSGPAPADAKVVHEAGVAMLVRPYAGQKTGLFLDQRVHRGLIRGWSAGRGVVNLFAYTGGFSVCAALGGAASVTTVDLAPEAIADARENFRLNGLDPDRYRFEVADAFRWSPVGRPDLVVVDPPALARDRDAVGAARSAYRKLHRRIAPWVPTDGLVATSSCTARLQQGDWARAVVEGLSGTADWSWHWRSAEPPDHPVAAGHPEGRYLKFGLLRRR